MTGVAGTAAAQPATNTDVLAEVFGAEPITSVALSPDGSRASFIQASSDGDTTLQVVDFAADTTRVVLGVEHGGSRLHWCKWANETRLLCSQRAVGWQLLRPPRVAALVGIDADASDATVLLPMDASLPLHRDRVIDWLVDDPNGVLVQMPRRQLQGLSLERLDIYTGARESREKMRSDNVLISDGNGTARASYDRGSRQWRARETQDDAWSGLQPGIPQGFGAAPNELLVLDVDEREDLALFGWTLGGDRARRLILAHPDGLLGVHRLGKHDRAVAALSSDFLVRFHYFDERVLEVQRAATEQLPNAEIAVVDESWDQRFYVLLVRSDHEGGRYVRFDMNSRAMDDIAPTHATLVGRKLALTRVFPFATRGGSTILGYLTLPSSGTPPFPAVIMTSEVSRDIEYSSYDFVAQYLAAKGYATLQTPTTRLVNHSPGAWRPTSDELLDGAGRLTDSGVADPSRMCVLGRGTGAYAALQAAIQQPARLRCAVGIGGMMGLIDSVVSGMPPRDTDADYISPGPVPPGLEEPSPISEAHDIAVPVLLLHGRNDSYMSVGNSREFAAALREAKRDVTYVEYEHADEAFRPERDRVDMLATLGRFLDTHIGPD